MTEEELKKVPFRETCHMAMEGEYTTTYMSKDGRLGFCDHVPRDKYGMVKKGGRAWHGEEGRSCRPPLHDRRQSV